MTACAICGSDLHIYDGIIPQMKSGDILGHETMGEVVEVGAENKKLKVGDRVVVPFTIACGECFFCQQRLFIPAASAPIPIMRRRRSSGAIRPPACSAIRICSAAMPAGRRNICACPTPMSGPIKVPDGLSDEQVLFLSDIFPTGYMAAEFCNIKGGDTDRDLGLRPGRPVRHPQRLPARRRAGHRHRYRARAAAACPRLPAPRRSIS